LKFNGVPFAPVLAKSCWLSPSLYEAQAAACGAPCYLAIHRRADGINRFWVLPQKVVNQVITIDNQGEEHCWKVTVQWSNS